MSYLKSKVVTIAKMNKSVKGCYCKMNKENYEKLKENFGSFFESSDTSESLKKDGYKYLYVDEEENKISSLQTLKYTCRKEMVLNPNGEWELKEKEDELMKIVIANTAQEANELAYLGYEVFNSFVSEDNNGLNHFFHMKLS